MEKKIIIHKKKSPEKKDSSLEAVIRRRGRSYNPPGTTIRIHDKSGPNNN